METRVGYFVAKMRQPYLAHNPARRKYATSAIQGLKWRMIIVFTVVSRKRAQYQISAHPPLLLQFPAKVKSLLQKVPTQLT